MKTNQRFVTVGLLVLCVAWTGCLFSPKKDDPIGSKPNYAVDLSIPDSLIHNLLESYTRQEIDPYANLLSRDYKFEFQTLDNDFPNGMNLTQDSTSTNNMFSSSTVTSIDLTMETEPPVNAKYEGEDTKLVAIRSLLLEIHTNVNATTLQVEGDIQEYHMIRGKEEDGEDPERYYIRAWIDIAGNAAPRGAVLSRIREALDSDAEGGTVVKVTMSEIHKYGSDITQLLAGSS